jgi:hypothetical protein
MEKELKQFINCNSQEITTQAVERITDKLLEQFIGSLSHLIREGKLPGKTKYGRQNNVSCMSNEFAGTFYEAFQKMVIEELKKGSNNGL